VPEYKTYLDHTVSKTFSDKMFCRFIILYFLLRPNRTIRHDQENHQLDKNINYLVDYVNCYTIIDFHCSIRIDKTAFL